MPRFDYQCNDCNEEFEYFIVRSDDHPNCPQCSGTNLRKKVSLFAVGNANAKSVAPKPAPKSPSPAKTSTCSHGHSSGSCNTSYADSLRKKHGYR